MSIVMAAVLAVLTACGGGNPEPAATPSTATTAVQPDAMSVAGDESVPEQAPIGVEEPLLRLAVLGDVGTGDENELATAGLVAAAAAGNPFDGLILLGDNVYENGDPERLDATVFDPFAEVLDAGAALLPVLGNHDVRDGNAAGQVERFGLPGRWYSEELGPVLFVGLDSNLVDDDAQRVWLETVLANSDAPWIITAMHHPAYSGGHHGSTEDVQEAWVPLFEEYGVDLVLAGHDHDYQRSVPINGITYLVSGAGARLRDAGYEDFTAYAESVLHFLDIVVWEDRIEVSAISRDGVFDGTTIAASALSAASS
ncbi:MAG: metallophosphoesterase [Acidimicrobiia bacterium]|nr:metallophosphoesterase [Acidimicrobiia bacterium]